MTRRLPYAGAEYIPGAPKAAPKDPLAENLRAQIAIIDHRIAKLQDEKARLEARLAHVEAIYENDGVVM